MSSFLLFRVCLKNTFSPSSEIKHQRRPDDDCSSLGTVGLLGQRYGFSFEYGILQINGAQCERTNDGRDTDQCVSFLIPSGIPGVFRNVRTETHYVKTLTEIT